MSEIYEGNSITVNNINKSKAKIKIRGGSRQATRSGYNLANLDADSFVKNGVTVTNNGDGSWTFNGTSSTAGDLVLTKNILLNHKIYQFEDATYLFKTIVVSGSFSNPDKVLVQTSAMGQDNGVDNFATLYNKLSDGVFVNIFNKKSTSHLSRFELYCGPNVTFNNYTIKILFAKTDNNELEWEQYGVSPSPDFPSEIKNVGDNINLLNKDTVDASNNLRGNALDTGRRLIANKDGNYTYGAFKLGGRELLGKTLGIHADIETTGGKPRISIFAGNSSSLSKSMLGVVLSTSGTGYITLPSSLSDELDTISAVLYVTTDTSVVAGTYVDYTNLKVQVGDGEVIYSDYNCGSIKTTECNKNLASWDNKNISSANIISEAIEGNIIKTEGNEGIANLGYSGGISQIKFSKKLKFGTQYTLSVKIRLLKQGKWSNQTQFFFGNKEKYSSEEQRFELTLNTYVLCVFNFKPKLENEDVFTIYLNSNEIEIDLNTLQIEENTAATDYIPHEEQSIIFPLAEGQKLYEGSYLEKDGIHNKRKQIVLTGNENIFESQLGTYQTFGIVISGIKQGTKLMSNYFTSYPTITDIKYKVGMTNNNAADRLYISNGESSKTEEFKALLSQRLDEGIPVIIEYELATEEIIPYTPKQQNAFYELQNIVLYDGINYISIDNELGSMSVEVSKIIEDYETYISSNGFFINSQNDIHYLIDFSESELPCMAEATETTVKAAGRNGDIVLSTTYDPNNFNIVCYTEDNLTQEEKVKEEMKLKRLLNSIKNKTIPLAFEKDDKFYKVKYSGAFSSTNFPKHLKFSIPLKTSEAYGKDLIKKVIFGNGEETSDTFEDVGAIFTIKGPANSPIISLNDYSIEYDNPLLEGDKLIINSSNSTITHINSDGVATNAMRYYNHQFPKIENGKNVLKVLSGVNEANVSVEWYDYKF